jgi:hypothetical protein
VLKSKNNKITKRNKGDCITEYVKLLEIHEKLTIKKSDKPGTGGSCL